MMPKATSTTDEESKRIEFGHLTTHSLSIMPQRKSQASDHGWWSAIRRTREQPPLPSIEGAKNTARAEIILIFAHAANIFRRQSLFRVFTSIPPTSVHNSRPPARTNICTDQRSILKHTLHHHQASARLDEHSPTAHFHQDLGSSFPLQSLPSVPRMN